MCLKDDIQFFYIKKQNVNPKLYKIHSDTANLCDKLWCVCIYIYIYIYTIIAMGGSCQRVVIDNRWLLLKYLVCTVLVLCDLRITRITTFCSLVGEDL